MKKVIKGIIKGMIEAYGNTFPIGALSCFALSQYAICTDIEKVKWFNTIFCLGYLIVIPIILAIIDHKLDKESD